MFGRGFKQTSDGNILINYNKAVLGLLLIQYFKDYNVDTGNTLDINSDGCFETGEIFMNPNNLLDYRCTLLRGKDGLAFT